MVGVAVILAWTLGISTVGGTICCCKEAFGGVPAEALSLLASPPPAVMATLREGIRSTPDNDLDAEESVRLMEAVRVLARRHGPAAVRHCTRLVQSVRELLDSTIGTEEGRS